MSVLKHMEAGLEEYRSIRQWLGNLAESTQRINLYAMNTFLSWIAENSEKFGSFSPDDFVEYQRNLPRNNEYEILDVLQEWVNSGEGRAGTKKRNYATIRGFFNRNRVALPPDPNFLIRSNKERVVSNLTIQEVKEIISNSNLVFKAAFLAIFQGGMDTSSFEYWNKKGYKDLIKQLRNDPEAIKIDLPGRKKARNITPFFTFIGGDAIDAIQANLKRRPETDETAILFNKFGKPLNAVNVQTYWRRLLKRRGFIETEENGGPGTRYGKSIHELRDVFRTQWQKSQDRPEPQAAEFMMGHQIDQLDYNKAFKQVEYSRGEYLKALPMLQIMSSGAPFGRVEGSRIKDLEKQLEEVKKGQNKIVNEMQAEIEDMRKQQEEMMKLLYERLPQEKPHRQ